MSSDIVRFTLQKDSSLFCHFLKERGEGHPPRLSTNESVRESHAYGVRRNHSYHPSLRVRHNFRAFHSGRRAFRTFCSNTYPPFRRLPHASEALFDHLGGFLELHGFCAVVFTTKTVNSIAHCLFLLFLAQRLREHARQSRELVAHSRKLFLEVCYLGGLLLFFPQLWIEVKK